MDRSYLAEVLERPDVIKKIIQEYDGWYSLGITLVPGSHDEFAFLLRVEDIDPIGLPHEVLINGHRVPVIVRGGHRPHALNRRKASYFHR
jgi:hypothetical protein